MTHVKQCAARTPELQATLLETDLDSICLSLGRIVAKVTKAHILEQMTAAEREGLKAAVARTRTRLSELDAALRGNA